MVIHHGPLMELPRGTLLSVMPKLLQVTRIWAYVVHTLVILSVPSSRKIVTQDTHHSVKEHCSYNHKVKPHTFEVGDLVLRENPKNQQDREKKGKFEPNWLGHYIITVVYGSGAYQLSTIEGEPLEDPINNMHLRRFYT